MPRVDAPYAPGTPCWVDLMAKDQQGALDFYGGLFGWRGDPGPPAIGGYTVVEKDGRAVCGIGPAMAEPGEEPGPEPPHAWTTYLASEDADASAQRITAAGGTVLAPPMDVGTMGRMVVAADPTGAVFGVWRHLEFYGAQLVGEPGALVWNDCETRDLPAAADFYRKAFGLQAKDMPGGRGGFGLFAEGDGDRPVGGLHDMGSAFPAEVPAHWLTCFAVADADATVAAHTAAGGGVLSEPAATPFGRLAGLTDPWGGVFYVMQQTQD